MNEKVYVVNTSSPKGKMKLGKKPAPPALPSKRSKSAAAKPSQQAKAHPASIRDRWARVLRAYLLGPIALVLWPAGRYRTVWLALGAGSAIAAISLLLRWSAFAAWAQTHSNGGLLWIATVCFVILTTATAWSRAVALAGQDRPSLASISSRRLCNPGLVGALGTIIPGFGQFMLGHFRRAASMLWITGLLVAAVIILANWRWLWSRSQSPVPPGISGTTLEGLYIAAAGIVILVFFTLIVQALDGARRFSVATQSRVFTDVVAVVMVVSLGIFAATFRPVSLGQSLGELSATLQNGGFRLIPLRLYEAATRLDPVTPAHLANAADINEELGMMAAAKSKRQILERRMQQYADIVRDNKRDADLSLMFSSIADSPLEARETAPAGEAWSRIQELLRAGGR
jgi:hypothetical protein